MKEENFNLEEVFEADDYLYFYQDALTEQRTKLETDFIIKELNPDSSMNILDLACGHGRHSNKLSELGYKLTGIDFNKEFLKIAEQQAKKNKLKVQYIEKDMRNFDEVQKYDIVLLLFTAFGYFSDQQNIQVLKNISKSLKPGGLFCFDTFNRDNFLKNFREDSVVEKDKNLMIDRCSFDCISGRYTNKRIIIRDGKRKDKEFSIRLYNYNEIQSILAEAGLRTKKVFGTWKSGTFNSDSVRIITIAEKN